MLNSDAPFVCQIGATMAPTWRIRILVLQKDMPKAPATESRGPAASVGRLGDLLAAAVDDLELGGLRLVAVVVIVAV